MYLFLHYLLLWTYALLPPAALLLAIVQSRRRTRVDGVPLFVLTCAGSVFISAGVTAAYATFLGGRLHAGQVVATWYFVVGLLCLLKTVRWVAGELCFRLLGVRRDRLGQPLGDAPYRAGFAKLLQTALLVAIAMPLITGALLSRRVRTYAGVDPAKGLDWDYTAVEFPATDGGRVAGWWIPAQPLRPKATRLEAAEWGRRTILLCHGMGENRQRQLGLIWLFASDGYNVLAIDPRGEGESGGQWGSFGDRERFDVLGAVRWAKAEHAGGAQKVFAVGSGTGGAAVIAAATDESAEGQPWGRQIDAVAVMGAIGDFGELVRQTVDLRLPRPLRELATRLVLPFASAHAGTDLMEFAPAKRVEKLWPRPILVIHGRGDGIVPFDQGWELFHAASPPRQALWLDGDHEGIARARTTARALRDFFAKARAVPVI